MAARSRHRTPAPFTSLTQFWSKGLVGSRSVGGAARRGASGRQSAYPQRSASTWTCRNIVISRPSHNRTRNHLYARATGMGAGLHRAKHCYRERRYRPALDAQCAQTSLSRLGRNARPITITIGMIPSTTAVAILAVTIRRFLATISSMVLTPRGQPSATMAWVTRSGWRRARSGSVAVTWMKAMARRPDTWSAWSSSSRPIRSTARQPRATRPKRRTSRLTHGVVRLRKAVRLILCKLLSKPRLLLASRW